MPMFDECVAKWDGILAVGSNFSFGGGGHDVANNLASCVDRAIAVWLCGGWLSWIDGILAQVEVASDSASSSGLREVEAVTVVMQDHVACVGRWSRWQRG
jgi:hypothetical protein